MSELEQYTKALCRGNIDACIRIEERHGLFGYPPEIVSIGLRAFDDGEDVYAAVDSYIEGSAK